jgi:hypothetical protein
MPRNSERCDCMAEISGSTSFQICCRKMSRSWPEVIQGVRTKSGVSPSRDSIRKKWSLGGVANLTLDFEFQG